MQAKMELVGFSLWVVLVSLLGLKSSIMYANDLLKVDKITYTANY